MSQTLPTTMAATVRASNKGLELVDKARCKKGWAKTEEAWAGLASTSKATLRRFWGGLNIQTSAFQAICMTVGIEDWESIAEFDSKDDSPPKTYEKRLSFAIAGSIEEIDKHKLDAIVALLQKLGGDADIEILDIEEGSVKLTLGGSKESLQNLQELFESGRLREVESLLVQDVHLLTKKEIIESIRNNTGSDHNFRGLNLIRANLREVDLRGADLREANLTGANLVRADLTGANLTGANLTGAKFMRAKFMKARVMRADLGGASLGGTDLREADLREADLRGADLIGTNLTGANLIGTNLTGANLTGTNLTGANLKGTNLTGIDLTGANLTGINLKGDLSETHLSGINLREANLIGVNLSGANLTSANLRGADLRGANLRRANLDGANLEGTDLSGANISNTSVTNTLFGNTQGLSDIIKAQLIRRGAIFKDGPQSPESKHVFG